MTTVNFTTTFGLEICCSCGMHFAMPQDYQQRRTKDHKGFYCPSGHRQYYLTKSREEELQDERDFYQTRTRSLTTQLEHAKNRTRAQKAAKTRIKNRVAKGVCPCCNRTFQNLQRHMTGQHPEWNA